MSLQLPIQVLREPARAELLLQPLRARILIEAREPVSAAEVARRLGETPQKVNYHVTTLVEAGLLLPAGERRRRNLVERRYRASARRYVLSPELLGSLGIAPAGVSDADAFSAARLLGLTALVQEEVAGSVRAAADAAEAEAREVPTLSLDAELAFASEADRAGFARALEEAFLELAARWAAPADGEAARPYRLVAACYPLPRPTGSETTEEEP